MHCAELALATGAQTLYLVVTTLIMGLELLTVVNATLCAILGPGAHGMGWGRVWDELVWVGLNWIELG